MGNGKAVRALLAIVAVIAACLPQPSLAAEIPSAPARIATQMTINGRPFSFESRRCVNIPAMPGAVKARVEVSRQQGSDAGNAAACRAIRFFQDPACTGQTLDLLPIIGTQSVKYVPGVVTSALCLTARADGLKNAGAVGAEKSGTAGGAVGGAPWVEETGGAVRGGVERGGAERGGAERGGAERGGAERGGAERGGQERGGAERGGAERGGAERGGAERGGQERGGAERGGAERGGAERGGAERGGAREGLGGEREEEGAERGMEGAREGDMEGGREGGMEGGNG
ncbi:unnamed protein product [Closterium sp. NIES-64]|nr:unnamed protein product [Closterium sp. NIES-64]